MGSAGTRIPVLVSGLEGGAPNYKRIAAFRGAREASGRAGTHEEVCLSGGSIGPSQARQAEPRVSRRVLAQACPTSLQATPCRCHRGTQGALGYTYGIP